MADKSMKGKITNSESNFSIMGEILQEKASAAT